MLQIIFGSRDVYIDDNVEYYEYECKKSSKKYLSIEIWEDETEVSLGTLIESKHIKILNEFDY